MNKLTPRQERIANGCNIILKEIVDSKRFGTKLATTLLKRLGTLCLEEANGEAEEASNLVALQEQINKEYDEA